MVCSGAAGRAMRAQFPAPQWPAAGSPCYDMVYPRMGEVAIQEDLKPARDNRRRRLGRTAAIGLPLLLAGLWAGFWIISRQAGFAAFAAGIQTAAVAAGVFLTARGAWSYRLTGRRQLNVILAAWAVSPALMAALLAAAFGLAAVPDAIIGVAAGVAAALAYARSRRRIAAIQLGIPLAVDSLAEAGQVLDATGAPGSPPGTTADGEAMRRLNRARALTFAAMREGDHDRLLEALPALRKVIQDGTLDPAVALLAADDLVNAESMLSERSRDGTRYAAAVDLYAAQAARNPRVAGAAARRHGHRADYQAFLEQAATDDAVAAAEADDEAARTRALARAAGAHRAVNRELSAALELSGPRDEVRAQYLSMLGSHLCLSLGVIGEDRLDEGIELCRQALTLPAGRRREYRPGFELSLASSLLARWDMDEDDRDLDEARALLRRLVRLGNPVEARARELLLQISVRQARGRKR
jgi:hypothetical protein